MTSDGLYISRFIWPFMAYLYIYQDLYDMWWLIYIKVYMASDGLDITKFMSQVMASIHEDLYHKWWLIYIKIYMTSDGLYISRFVWQVMVYIYQGLYD